ncbi:MAG: D-alanine--D-alanine ligase [Spirochaetales bacterium]|nr:D-alanine--D-alanine ligase [Spirochaetales bacterium]
MEIGLTFDLRSHYIKEGYSLEDSAEFDSQATVDSLMNTIRSLGHDVEAIGNIKDLVKKLSRGKRWDLVFNIAEGVAGYSREAQVPLLLEAYGIPFTFSDPLTLSLCLHKGMTKRVLRDLAVPTADFRIIEKEADVDGVTMPFPLFAKPVAEGTGKGIDEDSYVTTAADLKKRCSYLLGRFHQPVLIERFLPGREFTAGILGTGEKARVVGVLEVTLRDSAEKGAYSYINKEECEERVVYELASDPAAEKAGENALLAWRGLSCRDAGRIDLKLDEHGVPCVIELNPLAGLHPTHSDLPILCTLKGMSYSELINSIIASALERTTKNNLSGKRQ